MKRKTIIIIPIIIVVILIGGGTYLYAKVLGPQTVIQTNSDKANCRQGNIFDGVTRQARFTVLSTCERVVGIVHDMKGTKENDGDYQFNLALEQPYRRLLNQVNDKRVNGMLVIEIIPKDENSSLVQIPKNGDRIQAYGAWVTDNLAGGWNELHPAWELKKIE